MALIKCKECGTQVSTTAKACPSCGAAAPKKTSAVTWLAAIVIVPIVAVSIITKEPDQPSPAPPKLTQEQQAKELQRGIELVAIERTKKTLQASLKDPESAKFGPVFYRSGFVCGRVNAKNSYGAMTGDREFLADLESGKITMSDGTGSYARNWNKACIN